jgi:hypothetical protein
MEQLIAQYTTRLAQLNRGARELYEGERTIIKEILAAYKTLDN